MALLSKASTAATLCFVISSMLAMGAGLTVEQIVAALRNRRMILSALLCSFVLVPLGALVLARTLSLDEPLHVGLLLIGCAAGAPFIPKLAEFARGPLPFAVGMMVLLMVVTIVYMPLVLPVLLPNVTVSPTKIALSLLLEMLLPLGVALMVKRYRNGLAVRIKPSLDWLSNISLYSMILLMTLANFDKVLQIFGERGILAGLLLIALGCSVGWLLGGPRDDERRVLALGTGQRNIAAALVVGSHFSDPGVITMVVVISLVGLVTLIPLARVLGRRGTPSSPG